MDNKIRPKPPSEAPKIAMPANAFSRVAMFGKSLPEWRSHRSSPRESVKHTAVMAHTGMKSGLRMSAPMSDITYVNYEGGHSLHIEH